MRLWHRIAEQLNRDEKVALVSIIRSQGSVPREAGSHMLVTGYGFYGTIGGGALEWQALAKAQKLLNGQPGIILSSHALGPELGQCCGGRVDVAIQTFGKDDLDFAQINAEKEAAGPFTLANRIPGLVEHFGEQRREIWLFGAGHVGKALLLALAPLPFDVVWVDNRPQAFPALAPANTRMIAPADSVASVGSAKAGSLVFIMTHSHELDLALCDAALRLESIAHVGVIGSATKRARFVKRLQSMGHDAATTDRLICPIGLTGIRSKEPHAIAIGVAAQCLMLHEALVARAAEEFRKKTAK